VNRRIEIGIGIESPMSASLAEMGRSRASRDFTLVRIAK
jgi:hypothetical protein